MTLPNGHLDMSLYELAQAINGGAWSLPDNVQASLQSGLLVWTSEQGAFQVCLTHTEAREDEAAYYTLLFCLPTGATFSVDTDLYENFETLLVPFRLGLFYWLSYEHLHEARLAYDKAYGETELAIRIGLH